MSGRIADIAIHPNDDNIWYVAVASGGVWKTNNAGITWKPLFDDQSVFSTGCVTIDPHSPSTVWVGTGENDGGRHLGFGDGVYRSQDGGKSWTNMGLKNSEHVSEIIIHPQDPNTIWVAAQGPLWSSGGDRGLYKSTDGGHTWKKTLGNDKWTGVTDIAISATNPDHLYAATWDRHRTVAAYMGGGPGTGLHRSVDGGDTWHRLTSGLPKTNMGKIGLAISPQRDNVLYAAIELDRRTGGVYKSEDNGSTWTKQSNAVSGGTGPHYYQELYASPHEYDKLYLMDVRVQVSEDGGKNFKRLKEKHKHSDNHALAFRGDDEDYLLMGTDGGIYESFDHGENWRYVSNLPLTQFYKVAIDDAEPFYNIYGGTQDNSTQGGPSRTDKVQGIENSDWSVVLDWDGHQPATEPGNPNIVYGQRQQGNLARIDMSTGQALAIQPQPAEGEDFERFNWDAPIYVSPHSPTRLYFASQRLWRSEDRGDSWTTVSTDLTRNEERLQLPIMGGTQGIDNPWDISAMSNYNTITSISESPLKEDMLYIGTDDGIIQVTEDGGANWNKSMIADLANLPSRAYVNDIKADLHDANTVYAALDNHKEGDYRPFLIKSTDKGKSWNTITSNLPNKLLIWRIVQDHIQPNLLFIGTEFGIYFTINGGDRWIKLKGNVPTIPFRDLAIHKGESDLVGASFGRGFYILDDYSALRELTESQMNELGTLFPVRDAWWYIPRSHLGFDGKRGDQGASHFVADNPDFGAVFTYHLGQDLLSKSAMRKGMEKSFNKKGMKAQVPEWDQLYSEVSAQEPQIIFTIKNSDGQVVRRLNGSTKKGFHRIAWDLRYPTPNLSKLVADPPPSFGSPPVGLLVAPGKYSVVMSKIVDGEVSELSKEQSFEVVPLKANSLIGPDIKTAESFWREYETVVRDMTQLHQSINNNSKSIKALESGIHQSRTPLGSMDKELYNLKKQQSDLRLAVFGHPVKLQIGEKTKPLMADRLFQVELGISRSTYGPTKTAVDNLEIVTKELQKAAVMNTAIKNKLRSIADTVVKNGGPRIEGIGSQN